MNKADSNKLALVIGVDVYRSEGLEDLSSCRTDAEDVCKILQGLGYTIFQNGPIIGSKLNKENSWVDIHRAIVNFFGSAKPGQTLLFYFSGHGIQRRDEIYLAMPEVNTKDPMVEGFALTRLTDLMNSSRSMQIVSIIDACYSGAAALSTTTNKPKAMVAKESAGRALAAYDRILDNIPKAEGRCLLLSSQAYEPSLASDDSYSLYTKHLIEGLRGAKAGMDDKGIKYPSSFDDDGNVTPETLHKYLYHKVANEAEQVPKIKSDMASNIVLAHYPYLAKNRPDVNLIVKEGDAYFLQDEYDKAIECYDRAIESDPYLVDAWHKKGNALHNKERYDEAIECYDRASLINPNHFDSWYKKGLTYKKKNRHDQAIKSYDRAIEIRAKSSNVWYEKGLSLSYLKRYQEAIKCYDNAIELNPKHAEAWYRKGFAFYDMGMNDEAKRCYNRAKEINPDFRNEWYGGEPPPSSVSLSPSSLTTKESGGGAIGALHKKEERAESIQTQPSQYMPSRVRVGHDNNIIEGGGAPLIGSELPLPTDSHPSTVKEEVKKEPAKPTEKEEYPQQPSSTKSWKWIVIAGGAVGVILISMLATGLLSIPSPNETPIHTPAPDTTTTQPSPSESPTPTQAPDTTTTQPEVSEGQYSFVRAFGSYGSGEGQFSGPSGIAIDSQGFVYVADWGNNRVQKFDSDGGFITSWGSYSSGEFNDLSGIAIDSQGFVYVADSYSGNSRVQKFDSDGGFITSWGSYGSGEGQFRGLPGDIAIDSQGFVYVADWGNNRVQKFDSDGGFITSWGSYGSGEGQFSEPQDIAIDSQGFVYVADWGNNRVQKFDSDGGFITSWGSYGSGEGQFSGPSGIAIDSQGFVYVADSYSGSIEDSYSGNHRVQKFDSDGGFITSWGSYGSGEGQFSRPENIAIDSQGFVYVADWGNDRVQVWTRSTS